MFFYHLRLKLHIIAGYLVVRSKIICGSYFVRSVMTRCEIFVNLSLCVGSANRKINHKAITQMKATMFVRLWYLCLLKTICYTEKLLSNTKQWPEYVFNWKWCPITLRFGHLITYDTLLKETTVSPVRTVERHTLITNQRHYNYWFFSTKGWLAFHELLCCFIVVLYKIEEYTFSLTTKSVQVYLIFSSLETMLSRKLDFRFRWLCISFHTLVVIDRINLYE